MRGTDRRLRHQRLSTQISEIQHPDGLAEYLLTLLPDREPRPPLLIHRKLEAFSEALGLMVGAPTVPQRDFLIRVFTPHRSLDALLSSQLGLDYANLVNNNTGKHKLRASSRERLEGKLGNAFSLLAAGNGWATPADPFPLITELLNQMLMLPQGWWNEPLKRRSDLVCQGCGQKFGESYASWWDARDVLVGEVERSFVDEGLRFVAAIAMLDEFYWHFSSAYRDKSRERCSPLELYLGLAAADRHPIGQWMRQVMDVRGAKDLKALELQIPLGDDRAVPRINLRQLRAFSAGARLMPFDIAWQVAPQVRAKSSDTWRPSSAYKWRFLASRMLALSGDFLQAAWVTAPPTTQRLRGLIHQRLELHMEVLTGRPVGEVPRGEEGAHPGGA